MRNTNTFLLFRLALQNVEFVFLLSIINAEMVQILWKDIFVTLTLMHITTENDICRWLNALGVDDFQIYLADRIFSPSGTDVPLHRKLRLFVKEKMSKIPVSEAAMERCFNAHKRI